MGRIHFQNDGAAVGCSALPRIQLSSSSVNTLLVLKGVEGKKLGKGERRSVGAMGLQPPAPS